MRAYVVLITTRWLSVSLRLTALYRDIAADSSGGTASGGPLLPLPLRVPSMAASIAPPRLPGARSPVNRIDILLAAGSLPNPRESNSGQPLAL